MTASQTEIRAVHDYMEKPLAAFQAFCEKLSNSTQPKPPQTLYHYTNAEAFCAIATHGAVWASDIRYMNDSSEVVYASHLLTSEISKVVAGTTDLDEREFLDRVQNTFGPLVLGDFFAFCLTEDPDSIPQWIAYGGRRGGIAIGLELKREIIRVTNPAEESPLEAWIMKVEYDPSIQHKMASELVGELLPLYREAKKNFDEHLWTFIKARICAAARACFVTFILSVKEPGFAHEREWRLIVPLLKVGDSLRPSYRVGTMGLIPYLALTVTHRAGPNSARLPLCRLVTGPTAEPELARGAISRFVRDHGYSFVEVQSSERPLRF